MTAVRRLVTLVAMLVTMGWGGLVCAQSPSVRIPRVSSPPSMASFMTPEPAPREGEVSGFIQRDPRDGRPSQYSTRVFLSYDEERLYAVFVCRDDPAGVRARITRRENADADDSVSLYLDTFHDRRRAYVFSSNPLGVQSERTKTEGQDDDESFDTVWETEGRLTTFGYVVKMAIPFRSLRFSGASLQTWGIAVGRRIQRLNEDSYWPFLSRRVQGFVPQFADAVGLDRISPGANVQVTPFGAFTGARLGTVAQHEIETARRVGVDAKMGLGSAFVLDAALNPDFSEVESDEPQVTLNERFEVLFPERRSFFVENAGYFNTPVPMFFSRRILNPRGGAKLTGKAGPWVAAALAMQDRATPDADAASAAVGSLRREFGRNAHVGGLATLRSTSTGSHRAVSLDGRWTLGDTWVVAAQVARADEDNEGVRHGGNALFAQVSRDARHLDLAVQYTDLARDFSAPLGFIRRVDIRQIDPEVSYQWRPKGGPLVKFGPTVDGFVVWEHDGTRTDWRVRPRFEMEFVGQTSLLVDHARSAERLGGRVFDKTRSTFELETERSRWWSFFAAYEVGTDINRKPPRGQAPHLVRRDAMEVEAALRPGRHVVLSGTYLRTRLQQLHGPSAGRTVLDNHIARTKIYLHASRALTLRAILDYERVAPDAAFSAITREQPVRVDVLGSFELNPGTAVYVGYVERLAPRGFPGAIPILPDMESVGRQAFVKVSWLFRY